MPLTKQNGLTLIEIMIAVAILAILSAIAIPIYEGYVTEGRYGAADKDMRQMELLLQDLALDNDLGAIEPGGYTAGTEIDIRTAAGGITVDPAAAGAGPIWQDPWGQAYRYQRLDGTQNPQLFELRSAGPDQAYGGADDSCIRSDGETCGS